MNLKYIDIHSHLNLDPLSNNIESIIEDMKKEDVGTITVGVDYNTSKMALDLANKYSDMLWATVGQHPNDSREEIFDYNKYLELARNDKVVAIGECGLDYYRLKGNEEEKEFETERQKDLFKEHIKLAKEIGKPLMIHARPRVNSMDAYHNVINILEKENFTGHANFHFFVGDIEIAKKIIDKNWSVSFDGPITFSPDYDEVIKMLPIENIMTETDAPFASPVPFRGQTNYPQYVKYIYQKIALIKGLNEEEARLALINNAKRVFNL